MKNKLKCPVCDHVASYYNKLREVTLYYCDHCKHRFTDIKSIKNKETYTENYFKEKHPKWFETPNFKLFDYVFACIKLANLSHPSVLDVGCGNGDLLKYFHQKSDNMKLTGIDYQKNSAIEGINFLCGDIFDTKFSESYNVIINLAVIEHVWDVQNYIRRLRELCTDGGLIITMTQNDSSLLYGVARTIHNFGIKLPMEMLYDKHHLNHFSKNSLEYLHEKNSLSVIKNNITQLNIQSLTLPKSNALMTIIYKFILVVLFIFEKFIGKKNMQTITARKIG